MGGPRSPRLRHHRHLGRLNQVSDAAFARLQKDITSCRRCPRLVAWREEVAATKRASFRDQEYWGRPVPMLGRPDAGLLIVGLAPAAHGANRTGRMFTGDRSGDWLYRALHRAGFANQPDAIARGDGLVLDGAWITAPVKCAPPANKPSASERDACAPWFRAELQLLDRAAVFLCLGGYGFHALWSHLASTGCELPRPRPRFAHGLEVGLPDGRVVVTSYHPSQQNTFTGRLTEEMFDAVFSRVAALVGR